MLRSSLLPRVQITDQLITKEMKVFKGLSLTDQKIMFENLFVWDVENGDIPNRKDYKKWVLAFFKSQEHINNYISDLEFDIELSDGKISLCKSNLFFSGVTILSN